MKEFLEAVVIAADVIADAMAEAVRQYQGFAYLHAITRHSTPKKGATKSKDTAIEQLAREEDTAIIAAAKNGREPRIPPFLQIRPRGPGAHHEVERPPNWTGHPDPDPREPVPRVPGIMSIVEPPENPSPPGEDVSTGPLVSANPVEPNILPTAVEETGREAHQTMEPREEESSPLSILLGICMVFFVALIVTLLNSRPWESFAANATAMEILSQDQPMKDYLLSLLPEQTIAVINDSTNDMSPQARAFRWVLDDPDFEKHKRTRGKLVDRFALVCFYYSTGGETEWREKDNWLSYTVDEGSWFSRSIFKSSNQIINHKNLFDFLVAIDVEVEDVLATFLGVSKEFSNLWLADNGLLGTIPDEFYLLTSLKTVDLTANENLVGSISPLIGNLHQLEIVAFEETRLSGTLPSDLGRLENLLMFFAGDSNLAGAIPSELGFLSDNLAVLSLSNCAVESTIPTELGQLTSMLFLNFSMNGLSGTIPPHLGNLKDPATSKQKLKDIVLANLAEVGGEPSFFNDISQKLLNDMAEEVLDRLLEWFTGIDFSFNLLTGEVPAEIGSLGHMELWLHHNMLTGSFPPEIGSAGISHLSLGNNNLSGNIPHEIGYMKNVVTLDLQNNQISGPVPSEVGLMTSLLALHLQVNSLTGIIPEQIGLLPSLRFLYLAENNLTGVIPLQICPLRWLSFDCSAELCGCDCECLD